LTTSGYPRPLQQLIDELKKLPGIGSRTAERLAFFIMKAPSEEALGIAEAIREVKRAVLSCRECANFSSGATCPICADESRDRSTIMVVEHPKDLVAMERIGRYRGVYHVLLGHLSPHEGTGVKHLSVDRLLGRIRRGRVCEVILATNPDAEGDGTALVLEELLAPLGPRVTRLARGLPSGFTIEYAGTEILADALEGRRVFGAPRSETGAASPPEAP
jgi:recombination protein RecR